MPATPEREGEIKAHKRVVESEVYGEINAVRSAIHELHRAIELAHLNVEWIARYMGEPESLGSIGDRFLTDAATHVRVAQEKLSEAQGCKQRMVDGARMLKHLSKLQAEA